MHTHVHTCTYTYICTHVHALACTYTYTCTQTCVHTCPHMQYYLSQALNKANSQAFLNARTVPKHHELPKPNNQAKVGLFILALGACLISKAHTGLWHFPFQLHRSGFLSQCGREEGSRTRSLPGGLVRKESLGLAAVPGTSSPDPDASSGSYTRPSEVGKWVQDDPMACTSLESNKHDPSGCPQLGAVLSPPGPAWRQRNKGSCLLSPGLTEPQRSRGKKCCGRVARARWPGGELPPFQRENQPQGGALPSMPFPPTQMLLLLLCTLSLLSPSSPVWIAGMLRAWAGESPETPSSPAGSIGFCLFCLHPLLDRQYWSPPRLTVNLGMLLCQQIPLPSPSLFFPSPPPLPLPVPTASCCICFPAARL